MKRLTAVVAAAVLLVGCGNGTKTEAGEYSPDDFAQRMTEAMVAAKTVHVSMESGIGANAMSAEGDQINGRTPDEAAMDFQYEFGAEGFELRLVEGLVYVNYGKKTQNKFIVADPTDPDDTFGRNFAPMIASMDLATAVDNLSDAITNVEKSGSPKELDGVQTTPYDVTIDTSKMKDSPALEGVPMSALPKTLTYRFFMGSDDVPRRMSISVMGQEIVMDFTKVGEPVDIVAPDESEQVDPSILDSAA